MLFRDLTKLTVSSIIANRVLPEQVNDVCQRLRDANINNIAIVQNFQETTAELGATQTA